MSLSNVLYDKAFVILRVRLFVATHETLNQAFLAIHKSLINELCIPFSGMQECELLSTVTCMGDYRRGLDW